MLPLTPLAACSAISSALLRASQPGPPTRAPNPPPNRLSVPASTSLSYLCHPTFPFLSSSTSPLPCLSSARPTTAPAVPLHSAGTTHVTACPPHISPPSTPQPRLLGCAPPTMTTYTPCSSASCCVSFTSRRWAEVKASGGVRWDELPLVE